MIRFTLNKEEKEKDPGLYTYEDETGLRAYKRTAVFMLMKAVRERCGEQAKVWVEFNYRGNYFITVEGVTVDSVLAKSLKACMQEYCREAIVINRINVPMLNIPAGIRETGEDDSVLRYRITTRVNYQELDGYYAYFADHMLPDTSFVTNFDLVAMNGGLLLVFPDRNDFSKLNEAVPSGKLFDTQFSSQAWAYDLGIVTLADMNDMVCEGRSEDIILMQEAIFEKRIGDVAARIAEEKKKFVFLAGPSSSGKTTTANRLSVQLRAYGLSPRIISADNYFKSKEDQPLLPDGSRDLESIGTVDTDLFNADMLRLLSGEEIELPTYNFITREREYKGNRIRFTEKTVLIVEGIHCMNPVFSERIPEENKFLLYVSALTPLCVDAANHIPTSDCRLLRRIIRDARTRGYSAAQTIRQWVKVREGEEENIFPYQENADEIVNSAMIYELCAIKTYAEPLLFRIGPDEPEYDEARRLLKFLSFVLAVPTQAIPITSVIREFIGGSYFDV